MILAATKLTKDRTYRVAVLLGRFDGSYHLAMMRGLERAARILGVQLLCFRDSQGLNTLSTIPLDGILLDSTPYYLSAQKFSEIKQSFPNVPLVCVGPACSGAISIGVANYHASFQMTMHLIKEHGHSRIAYLHGRKGHPEAEDRYQAYCDALREAGLPFDEALVAYGDFSIESGRDALVRLLDDGMARFTAVMAGNDLMALGAAAELRKRGFRIPQDIALTGFDDSEESRYGELQLTSAYLPLAELVFTGLQAVIALCEGEQVQPEFILNAQSRFRLSCGCRSVGDDSALPESADLAGYQLVSWFEIILRSHFPHFQQQFVAFRSIFSDYLQSDLSARAIQSTSCVARSLKEIISDDSISIDTLRKLQHMVQSTLRQILLRENQTEWESLAQICRDLHFVISAELSRKADSENLEYYQYLRFEMAAGAILPVNLSHEGLLVAFKSLLSIGGYQRSWLCDAMGNGLILDYCSGEHGEAFQPGIPMEAFYEKLGLGLHAGLGLVHGTECYGYLFFTWQDLRFARFENLAIQIVNALRVLTANEEIALAMAEQQKMVDKIDGVNIELESTLLRLHERQQQLIAVRKISDLNTSILGISAKVSEILQHASSSAVRLNESWQGLDENFAAGTLTIGGTRFTMQNIADSGLAVMETISLAAGYIERLRDMAGSQGIRKPEDFDLNRLLLDILETQKFLLQGSPHSFCYEQQNRVIQMHSWPQILSKVIVLLLTYLTRDVLSHGSPDAVLIQAESVGDMARIILSAQGSNSRMDQIPMSGIYDLVTKNLQGNLSFGWTEDSGMRFVIILPCNLEPIHD